MDRSAPEVDGVLMVEIIKQGTNTGSMTLQVTPITIGNFVATYGTLPAEFTMINLNIPDPAECELIILKLSIYVVTSTAKVSPLEIHIYVQ